MEGEPPHDRLSKIPTLWSVLQQAHEGPAEQAGAACRALLERYGGAVYRYLLGALRDPEAAGDLAQEFALRFVRGDFRRAAPERGRFRDYLKTALAHLIADHHRQRQHWPEALAPTGPELAAPAADSTPSEAEFVAGWRATLLERAWHALLQAKPRYHAVLWLRVEQPDQSSSQAAERLRAQFGEPCNAAWVRKTLQRAHDKYADLLLEEVAQSLTPATTEALRQELHALDLLKFCTAALERWSG
jgi:RNA polymerase sigma-70 factor (ECF subfamily)